MGDSRRNKIFAEFIFRQYGNQIQSCLVVADGKGELSRLLSKKYAVRVIEVKPRQVRTKQKVSYIKGWFDRDTKVTEDLIVGMHPDEATSEIIRAAVKNNRKWVVVPCCVKGKDAARIQNFREWINKLKQLCGFRYRETRLRFNGKNLVLWG